MPIHKKCSFNTKGQEDSLSAWTEGSRKKAYNKWTTQENLMYAQFLRLNLSELGEDEERRRLGFFNKMAEHLNIGKNNIQCRSHHQKMLKKHKTISCIIQAFAEMEKHSESSEQKNTPEIIRPSFEAVPELYFPLQISLNSAWVRCGVQNI